MFRFVPKKLYYFWHCHTAQIINKLTFGVNTKKFILNYVLQSNF